MKSGPDRAQSNVWVCGEALIDILPGNNPIVGGGPANTAKALGRLGYDVQFIDGISNDAFGQSVRKELLGDGVGLELSLASEKPTCTATVTLSKSGGASYEFVIDNTATFDFNTSWLPDLQFYTSERWQQLSSLGRASYLSGLCMLANLHPLSLIRMFVPRF
jgi:sugar/nucleoside kinase (ribokinase family)